MAGKNNKIQLRQNGQAIVIAPVLKSAEDLMDYCESELGFRPGRGDVMAYGSINDLKLYVTKSGYSKLANKHKVSTKIEIVKIERKGVRTALVKSTAVLPNGSYHEEFGYCDSTEPGKQNKIMGQIIAMAVTRARSRSLNIATQITAGTFDELDHTERKNTYDISEFEEEKLFTCPKCKEVGYSKIQKACTKCDFKYEDKLEELKE